MTQDDKISYHSTPPCEDPQKSALSSFLRINHHSIIYNDIWCSEQPADYAYRCIHIHTYIYKYIYKCVSKVSSVVISKMQCRSSSNTEQPADFRRLTVQYCNWNAWFCLKCRILTEMDDFDWKGWFCLKWIHFCNSNCNFLSFYTGSISGRQIDDVLKSQLAPECVRCSDYRAYFWEFLKKSARS